MKIRTVLSTIVLCASLLATGCGSKNASDYSKYVKLSDYKNLTVDRVAAVVTDEDVQEEIQNNLTLSADYIEITDRAAENGDDIIFDLITTVDGQQLEDSSGEDFEFELGSDMMIEGFDEQIIGMKTGDTKEFKLTFPTPYDGTLDGKEGTFKVTVKTIYEISVPEYNDEYVADITDSEYKTTAEYEAYLKQTLQETAVSDAQSTACENALQEIVSTSEFSGCPEELLKSTKESLESENQEFAEALGLDDISELFGDDYDLDEYAQEMVNEKMVVYTIAAKEKLSVTDEEYEEALTDTLADSDYETIEDLKKDIDEESYKYDLLYQKVLDFLGETCTFNDVDEEDYYSDEDELLLEEEPEPEALEDSPEAEEDTQSMESDPQESESASEE